MPSIDKIVELRCSEQMQIYNRAAAQLDPHYRHRLKRRGKKPFKIGLLTELITAISEHWEKQRHLCQQNPEYFRWPTTTTWLGDGPFSDANFEQEGALKLFGYSVSSVEDLSDHERQHRLDVVFQAVVPPFAAWYKVLEWGEPCSAARLKKMANCLASFARNGTRRRADWMVCPFEKWTADLAYLRKKYYRDHFGFEWPLAN